MRKKELSLILFDFHNVLSKGDFYKKIASSHAEVYTKLMETLFGPKAYSLTSRWMKGEFSYKDIHKMIATTVGMSSKSLDEALIESVKEIEINKPLFEFSQKIRSHGIKIAILTDNMDVFEEVYVPCMKLDEKFDNIFSSYRQKKLKLENNGELIFEAISALKSKPDNTLLIDDCLENGDFLKKAGGFFYQYDRYLDGHHDFLVWFNKNFSSFNSTTYDN